jgi:16S rRNA (uracil1498-N3)-methyltransferase
VGGGREAGVITVLVPPGVLAVGQEIVLEDGESHHLKVRRASTGAPIRALDGAGGVAEGTLTRAGAGAALRVDRVRHLAPLPFLRLVVGAGDRERFEWLVEKAAEFGVTELVPLVTERTESVATRLRGGGLDRVRRRAREAIKQSLAPWAVDVADPSTPAAIIERCGGELRWLADVGGEAVGGASGDPLTAVIGPEGGLTNAERALFLGGGFIPVRVAPHILRFESAALAVAALSRAHHQGGIYE